MRIGELAARTGVSVRSLRYYEDQRLLAPERSSSGQRRYADQAVERVQLIQHLYAAGLSSANILEMLPCVVTGEASPAMLARLKEHRASVDRQISDLRTTRDRLDAVIASATEAWESGRPCEPR